jgi:hypothetical protein
MKSTHVELASIVTLVLALSGCWCRGVEDEVNTSTLDGTFMDAELDSLRMGTSTDEQRCEAACMMLVDANDTDTFGDFSGITQCTATGADAALPTWDAGQTSVMVTCEAEYTSPGFCTGRRPLGHRELGFAGRSRGAYFAEQAHLERASIGAFIELACWLERHAAPAELIARCRAAADDEVVHGHLMAELAAREGWEVPVAEHDAAPDDLLAVALHNAVEGCVRESFGAVLGAAQASACPDELRETFATIARDELRHGQLAWDIHAHLLARLDADRRRIVEAAQRRALLELARDVEQDAARTPAGLGWPTPEQARTMAEQFAGLIERDLTRAA